MDLNRDELPSSDESKAHFLRLFLASERELFRYVAALVPDISDAEEIVQQTAVELWGRFDRFDPSQAFTPWACRFALNVVKQWVSRREKWRGLLDEGLAEQLAGRREELRPAFDQRMKHLDGCLEKLPAEQRGIVQAYYFRRESVEAIAANARRSVEGVYKVLQRVRAMLRECIERAMRTGEML